MCEQAEHEKKVEDCFLIDRFNYTIKGLSDILNDKLNKKEQEHFIKNKINCCNDNNVLMLNNTITFLIMLQRDEINRQKEKNKYDTNSKSK